MEQYRGTTILSVRRNGKVVVGVDGQVTMGNTVMKGNARKVRRRAQAAPRRGALRGRLRPLRRRLRAEARSCAGRV